MKKGRKKMIEIEFRPHEAMELANKIARAEYEYVHAPLVRAVCGSETGTAEAFTLNELEEIATHIKAYVDCERKELEDDEAKK